MGEVVQTFNLDLRRDGEHTRTWIAPGDVLFMSQSSGIYALAEHVDGEWFPFLEFVRWVGGSWRPVWRSRIRDGYLDMSRFGEFGVMVPRAIEWQACGRPTRMMVEIVRVLDDCRSQTGERR